MKTKRFLIFAACCLLCLTLTGCGDGKVQSTVSRIGDDVSNAVSRVESALDPDDDTSSGVPTESEQSSMPGYTSSQSGDVSNRDDDDDESDAGSDTMSDGQVSSDVNSDLESEASEDTKDL